MSNKLLGGIGALVVLAIVVAMTLRDQSRLIAFDKQTGALLDAFSAELAAAATSTDRATKLLDDMPTWAERAKKLPTVNHGYRKKLREDLVGIFPQIGEYGKSHVDEAHSAVFYNDRLKTVFDGFRKKLKEGEEEESAHKE